jgi:predicted Zn-dependent protease with MMP-like domain
MFDVFLYSFCYRFKLFSLSALYCILRFMSDEQFEKLVKDAIQAIPNEFKDRLDNVDITIADMPTPQQLRKLRLHDGMLLLGLYEGVPQTKRGAGYTFVLPDKITIFKEPILQLFQTDEAVKNHVRFVVQHELGHHFGLSDEAMRKIGR